MVITNSLKNKFSHRTIVNWGISFIIAVAILTTSIWLFAHLSSLPSQDVESSSETAVPATTTSKSRAPKVGQPNSIWEQVDEAGNIRSRTYYDGAGRPLIRQDFDHTHGGIQPHEHQYEYNERGQKSGERVVPLDLPEQEATP